MSIKAIRTNRAEIKAFWDANVDYENGDAVLISVCPSRIELIAAILLYRINVVMHHLKRIFTRRQAKILPVNLHD